MVAQEIDLHGKPRMEVPRGMMPPHATVACVAQHEPKNYPNKYDNLGSCGI